MARREIRTSDGASHPVSDPLAERFDAAFVAEWFSESQAQQWLEGIKETANARKRAHLYMRSAKGGRSPYITDREEARLKACDMVVSMNSAARALQGRDYREMFGPDATLDQVHGGQSLYRCGCVINYFYDHWKAQADQPHDHHPHYSYPCDEHAHFGSGPDGNFKAHFAAVARA